MNTAQRTAFRSRQRNQPHSCCCIKTHKTSKLIVWERQKLRGAPPASLRRFATDTCSRVSLASLPALRTYLMDTRDVHELRVLSDLLLYNIPTALGLRISRVLHRSEQNPGGQPGTLATVPQHDHANRCVVG